VDELIDSAVEPGRSPFPKLSRKGWGLVVAGTMHPVDQATLSTRVMGRITQLSLEAGDRFRKGAVLAEIDVMDMTAQTNQAQAGVTQAQAEVTRSQATLSQCFSGGGISDHSR
jgi:multidrug efflux pump subunit AcrA (membrane-fusion protein)